MQQYLLAVYYADRRPSAEEFQRLCVDVPALGASMPDLGGFWIIDVADLDAAPGVGQARHGRAPGTSRGRPVRNAGHRRVAGGERGRRAVTMSVPRP